MNQLDISEAWKSAGSMVATNRDVLGAIAGVFILLPNLASAFFFTVPQIPPSLRPREQMALLGEAYLRAAPLLLPLSLVLMAGLLIVIVVMTDRSRPTVAAAIRSGAIATLPYLGVQLLVGVLLQLIFAVIMMLAAAIGNAALAALLSMLALALLATICLRMAMVVPVLACEHERNPIVAMRRSWQLTQGNALRLAAFLLLVLLLFMVIYGLFVLFAGVLLALTASSEVQKLGLAIVSSVLSTAAMVYGGAVLAAVHRQLAGPTGTGIASTFD